MTLDHPACLFPNGWRLWVFAQAPEWYFCGSGLFRNSRGVGTQLIHGFGKYGCHPASLVLTGNQQDPRHTTFGTLKTRSHTHTSHGCQARKKGGWALVAIHPWDWGSLGPLAISLQRTPPPLGVRCSELRALLGPRLRGPRQGPRAQPPAPEEAVFLLDRPVCTYRYIYTHVHIHTCMYIIYIYACIYSWHDI